jgi:hypothetical protein
MGRPPKFKLPSMAFGRSNQTIVVIVNGEDGYHAVVKDEKLLNSAPRELNLDERIDYINTLHGVTKAHRQAMEFGSMFGWKLPLANPDIYNENGVIIIEKLKKH